MGNRAVIATEKRDIGVYLHWNGGRDSVEAFLLYCKLRKFAPPEEDGYGWARLCQVVGNFFGGGLSLALDRLKNLDCDNQDNGLYLIRNWEIVGREHFDGAEQAGYDLFDMLVSVNNAQQEADRLPVETLLKAVRPAKGDRAVAATG